MQYKEYLEQMAPEATWHVPLVSVSSPPPNEPLRQPFHQTMRILSIGEGDKKGSLWIRFQINPSIIALRDSLLAQLQPTTIVADSPSFVPHIYLGSFANIPSFGILDTPLTDTFSIHELHVIQPDSHEIIASIPITP